MEDDDEEVELQQAQDLLPGLPDDLALICLSHIPRAYHYVLKSVCRGWRQLFFSGRLFARRQELQLLEGWLYVRTRNSSYINTWRAFDPLSATWHSIPPLPNPFGPGPLQARGLATAVVEGCLYAFGGWKEGGPALGCAFCYDPHAGQWHAIAALPVPRCYMAAASVGRQILVAGGMSRPSLRSEVLLTSALMYDTKTGSWEILPDMPKPALFGCGIAFGRLFHVVYKESISFDSHILNGEHEMVYDPSTRQWQMLGARQLSSSLLLPTTSLGDLLFCMGTKLQVWDTRANEWRNISDCKPAKESATAMEQKCVESPVSCMCFVGERLFLVRENSSVMEVNFNRPIVTTASSSSTSSMDDDDGHEEAVCDLDSLKVERVDFVSWGISCGDEQAVDCNVLSL